jgi:dienelactone hydrolase
LRSQSVAERWAALKPHVTVHGPPGRRPTVLLFHGCGGLGGHLPEYAAAATRLGVRSIVVDSFAPRGWSPAFGRAFVCTGMWFRGAERAGDVLAATWGAITELDADPDGLVLAGWSHGAWSIMDLMTMPLKAPGEAGLEDPSSEPLLGLKGLFLAYPYGGVAALSRSRPWVRRPPALAILAERDFVTRPPDSERLYDRLASEGCELQIWRVPAAHAFDEPDTELSWLRYDSALAAGAVERFAAFLSKSLAIGIAA